LTTGSSQDPPTEHKLRGDDESARTHPTADYLALLTEVAKLGSEVEEAWSAALDTSDGTSTNHATVRKWQSLIRAVMDEFEYHQERFREAHVGNTTVTYPVTPTYFERPDDEKDSTGRADAATLAELYAIADLANALRGLNQPTATSINMATGESRTWWEAGAFGLIADRAVAAIRVLSETATVRQSLLEIDASERTESHERSPDLDYRSWLEQLQLGIQALSHGLGEAAVTYLARAVRWMVEPLIQGDGRKNSDIVAALVATPEGNELGLPAAALLDTAHRLGNGNKVSAVTIQPLAHFWVSVFENGLAYSAIHDFVGDPTPESETSSSTASQDG